MVHVIDVDFKVKDVNRRAAARRDAGDLNQSGDVGAIHT
jgi:hypothetical protein